MTQKIALLPQILYERKLLTHEVMSFHDRTWLTDFVLTDLKAQVSLQEGGAHPYMREIFQNASLEFYAGEIKYLAIPLSLFGGYEFSPNLPMRNHFHKDIKTQILFKWSRFSFHPDAYLTVLMSVKAPPDRIISVATKTLLDDYSQAPWTR